MSNSFPPQGQMVLYSSATPPLEDGSYELTVETDVGYNAGDTTADAPPGPLSQKHYFNVVGPRFTVPQAMVAGCFPPRNAHGSFQDALPHIVIGRRTLPWERTIVLPPQQIPVIPVAPEDPPVLTDPCPWVALLLFEEGEYTLLRNIPLEQAVAPDVFTALGKPSNIMCDAVEADRALIRSIMPTYEELRLLVHVRQVNTDDRELNAYGGDGYFSVVVANRLPSPNAQCRAILVSLEQQHDLIPLDADVAVAPPPTAAAISAIAVEARATVAPATTAVLVPTAAATKTAATTVSATTTAASKATAAIAAAPFSLSNAPVHIINDPIPGRTVAPSAQKARLVALTSWQFTCEGPGTFRELMQGLDDAMFGTVAQPGKPPLTDTGHLPVNLQDRAGATESVLYRGPLVQYQLTRDGLGPYHCADQARRVTPESGMEDISYAAAFEVGRLLAAADGRLAQALMRWRRESFKQSARADTIGALATRLSLDLPATLAEKLHTPVVPITSTAASIAAVNAHPLQADAYGLGRIAAAPGMQPAGLAAAWQLTSDAVATGLLGGDPGSLGAPVASPAQTARPDTTIDEEATDSTGLARLSAAREQAVANAGVILEGQS